MSARKPALVAAVAALVALAAAGEAAAARPSCFGKRAKIVGTIDDDVLQGTAKADVIVGGGGSDAIRGLRGDDLICGGPGDDIIDGGLGRDRVDGGAGADTCRNAERRTGCGSAGSNSNAVYAFELFAVAAADDDGSRATAITPEQFAEWVARANEVFAAGRISFRFDPASFARVNSTRLNNTSPQALGAAIAESTRHPGRIVVVLRHGAGALPTGVAFSGAGLGFVVGTAYDEAVGVTGLDAEGLPVFAPFPYVLAHELGHLLGLGHTFVGASDDVTDTVAEALAEIRRRGGTAQALDGDGIRDTPPEAGLGFYLNQGWDPCIGHESYSIGGLTFTPDRSNLMSYFACATPRLTAGQLARAREGAAYLASIGFRTR